MRLIKVCNPKAVMAAGSSQFQNPVFTGIPPSHHPAGACNLVNPGSNEDVPGNLSGLPGFQRGKVRSGIGNVMTVCHGRMDL